MADAFFTRAPSTIVTIPLTGQLEFTIPFEFLARKFVVVTLLGTDRKVLTLGTDYRFIAVNKIQLARQPDGEYTRIELRRITSATDRLVTFIDGSILRATDLNLAQVQTMHVAEEARDMTSDNIGVNDDGDLDARNRKIVNLADGENPLDAVNLGQLRQFDTSTGSNADKAERSASAAKVSETNAANSEDRCVVAEAKAISSAGTAMTAAADANRSKVAAKQSEDRAAAILSDVEAASGPSTELISKVNKASEDASLSLTASTDNTQQISTLDSRVTSLETRKSTCLVNATGTGAPHETVSPQLPASIVTNTRYVLTNPFGANTPVSCVVELLVNGKWAEAGWAYTGPSGVYGVRAGYVQGEGVVIQTAKNYVLGGAADSGGLGGGSSAITSAPCRVFVRRIDT